MRAARRTAVQSRAARRTRVVVLRLTRVEALHVAAAVGAGIALLETTPIVAAGVRGRMLQAGVAPDDLPNLADARRLLAKLERALP